MDRWIKKTLEYDEKMIQLECPECGDDKFYTHIESEHMPNYCPMCGARLYEEDNNGK